MERLGRVDRGLARQRRQPIDQSPELEFAEEPNNLGPVVVGEPSRLQVKRNRQVADDSRQFAAHEDLLAGLDQLFAELVRLHFVEPAIDALQRPELADQLGSGLLPHSGDAGDVVCRIALEGLVVDHLVRPQFEPLPDPCRVVVDRRVDALACSHEPRVLGHDLEHVQVAGDDGRIDAALVQVPRDRAYDVIGFVPGHLVDGDAQCGNDFANLRELRPQVVRHGCTRRLVPRELLVAKRWPGQIEAGRDVFRLEILDAAQENTAEPEDGVDELALARGQGRQGVVATVDEAVAVEQHQTGHWGLEVAAGGAGAGS